MANDLVVQLGAKLDQFSKDMDQAGDIADSAISRIESSFANLNPAMGGLAFLGSAASLAGIVKLLDKIAEVNKDLADLNALARQTGLSLADIQGFKFGANVSGVDDSSFNQGLERSASLLNDAQRNVNSLSKLFDENGLSIRNANGQLISQNQLLTTAAELVRRAATEQDKIKIAEMLGFTQQWVPYLEQGASAIGQMASEAQAAGAVIDDETIKKADEFDKAWRKSSVEWSAALKEAALSVLPFIDDLILRSGKIFTRENLKKFAQPGQDAISDTVFGGLPAGKSYDIAFSPETNQAAKDLKEASGVFDSAMKYGAFIATVFSSKGLVATETNDRPPTEGGEGPFQQFGPFTPAGWKPTTMPEAKTKIPSKGSDASDAFGRATESITKHTARLEADTESVGKGAAAQEELRAQAQLFAAAQQAGIPITDKVRNQIQDLAQDAGDAAEALARAKVANDISRGQQTSFLSPDDVQIANKLKDIYPDVATALESVEASGLRANQALSGISSTASSTLTSGLTDILDGTKSVSQGFADMSKAIIRALEEAVIKMAIVAPTMRALQQLAGGFLGGDGGNALPSVALPGGGYSAPIGPTQFDSGGYTGAGGKFQPAGVVHKGEVVWSQDDVARAGGVAAVEALRKGNGYAFGGPVGMPSIPSVASRDSGNTQVNVNVKNYSNEQANVQQKPNGNGGVDLEVVIGSAAARQASMPGSSFSRALDQRNRVASR